MSSVLKKPRALPRAATQPRPLSKVGSRTAHEDQRWPALVAALRDLHEQRRHAVRIVDADCGCGCLLLEAARYAQVLGFTAIEARGIDGSPALIGRARVAAARFHDHAIGVEFDLADMVEGLTQEADFPADIVLCGSLAGLDGSRMGALLRAAGKRVISISMPDPRMGGCA